jgi:hypothetical protein
VPPKGRPGRRLQKAATYFAMTGSLLGMADHLRGLGHDAPQGVAGLPVAAGLSRCRVVLPEEVGIGVMARR